MRSLSGPMKCLLCAPPEVPVSEPEDKSTWDLEGVALGRGMPVLQWEERWVGVCLAKRADLLWGEGAVLYQHYPLAPHSPVAECLFLQCAGLA